ncbi:MAG TPA: alpha/beta hydrolase [Blastocatellia bacterium]|jgi:pimeloyl-ACP methyl ester carboxylesterase
MILSTTDGPIYFEVAGEGAPLVFISGWAMSSECWRPVVAQLAVDHRCLIYDPRGVARSQPATADARFEIEDHAEDLHSLISSAGFYDATLIAHETGTLVAALAADRHPQDASSLALVSPRAVATEDEIKKLSVLTPTALALREMATYPVIRNLVAWRFRRAKEPYRKRLFEDFSELDPRAAYQTALSAADFASRFQLDEFVEGANLPTLVVCGEKDRRSREEARKIFSRAERVKLATLKDCGFLPMLEYPRQFARLIRDFVAKRAMESKTLKRL